MGRRDVRVLLIGGTSHVGKSTVARALAAGLGWRHLSTDRLARHPGRPWGTVPDHVREHYTSLPVPELTAAQLRHYEQMWPTIRAAVEESLASGEAGLVLEGSGIWPDRAAALDSAAVAGCWLTADAEVLGARIRAESRFDELPAAGQLLVTKFVGRTVGFEERLRAALEEAGRTGIDTGDSPAVDELVARLRSAAGR
jgi:predicted kinase